MGAPRRRGGSDRHGTQQPGGGSQQSAGTFFGGGGYASHGAYMVEKTRKLKEQLAAVAEAPRSTSAEGASSKPQIFKGLSFWMTGRTCLPDQELKRLIVEHGGIYEQYGFTRVSHIIADNLATGNQQWRELRNRVKRGSVVISSWIVDCIAEKRRLPETRYMPKCLSTGSTMLSFLGASAASQRSQPVPIVDGASAGPDLEIVSAECGNPPEQLEGTGSAEAASASGAVHAASAAVRRGKRQLSPDESTDAPLRQPIRAASHAFTKLFNPAGVHVLRENPAPRLPSPQLQNACKGSVSSSSSCLRISSHNSSSHDARPPRDTVQDTRASACSIASGVEAAPLALEVSAMCSEGLSGSEELSTLLVDLSRAAGNKLKFRSSCIPISVGLRVTMHSGVEWCGFRDLKNCWHGADASDVALPKGVQAVTTDAILNELEKLSQSALAALPLESAGGWSLVRRTSVQLCLRELAPSRKMPRHRRRWQKGMLKPGEVVLGVPWDCDRSPGSSAFSASSPGCLALNEDLCSVAPDLTMPSDLDGVGSLAESDFVEDLCSPPHAQLESGISPKPSSGLATAAEVVQAARNYVEAERVTALVNSIRACYARGCNMPGAARQFLQLALPARCLQSFQDFAAALWALWARGEFDTAVAALRALRISIAAINNGFDQDGGLTAPRLFNALLCELSKVFTERIPGCRIDIAALPESV